MTARRRAIAAVSAAMVLGLLVPDAAQAAVSTHRIDATGTGIESEMGTRTVATIVDGGLLTGRTVGTFTPGGISPEGIASFAGTVEFTVNRGTLLVHVTGTLDTTVGTFQAVTDSMSGTGKLAGATGSLTFAGQQNAQHEFTETVRGTISVDLSP